MYKSIDLRYQAFECYRLPKRVLPVPGGPVRRTPLGVFAERRVYRRASLRQATTSSSSSLAVSSPATSLKVTVGACSLLFVPFFALCRNHKQSSHGVEKSPISALENQQYTINTPGPGDGHLSTSLMCRSPDPLGRVSKPRQGLKEGKERVQDTLQVICC